MQSRMDNPETTTTLDTDKKTKQKQKSTQHRKLKRLETRTNQQTGAREG